MRMARLAWLTLLLPSLAWADDPKFEYRAPEEKPPEKPWVYKANANLGLTWISGNSESIGFTANALGGVKHYQNAFEAYVAGNYAKAGSSSLGTGGPIDQEKVAAKNWLFRARYDRYFFERNTVFASFGMSGDELAGYIYRIEPQLGYSRLFVKNDINVLRGELGYDYTYERYVAGVDPRSKDFHSARGFLGVEHKLTPFAGFLAGFEVLWALNKIEHVRINAISSLSATVSKRVTLKVNLTVKANFDPPDRPAAVGGGKYGVVDTILDAVLGVTFL